MEKNNQIENKISIVGNDNAGFGYMYGNRDAVTGGTLDAGGLYSKYDDYTGKTVYISSKYTYDVDTTTFSLDNPIEISGDDVTEEYIGYYITSTTPTPRGYLYRIIDIKTAGKIKSSVMYYGTSTKEVAQTNTNDSDIKVTLDDWYKTNILGSEIEQYISDNIFCNNRSFSNDNTGTGAGISYTSYSNNRKGSLNLKCPQQNDAFTVSDKIGNTSLTYPVGLITADEAGVAGYTGDSSDDDKNGNYLYMGLWYWTMSPHYLNQWGYAYHSYVASGGFVSSDTVYQSFGIRPVINIKPETLKLGTGTMDDPYRVE